jgi:hypothetical protein
MNRGGCAACAAAGHESDETSGILCDAQGIGQSENPIRGASREGGGRPCPKPKNVGPCRQGRALIPLDFLNSSVASVGPHRQQEAREKADAVDFIDEFRWHANWVQKANSICTVEQK